MIDSTSLPLEASQRVAADLFGSIQRVAVISTSLPRKCGIATFANDLCDAIQVHLQDGRQVHAVAMDDVPEGYSYGDRVKFQVQMSALREYLRAADFLNINRYDFVCVQFEHGIFGGPDGAHLLHLLQSVRAPVVTTIHTAVASPSRGQKRVLQTVARHSDCLAVISRRAGEILQEVYEVPGDRIVHIPHGIPDVPFSDPSFYKDIFGVERNKVILTVGLLGPNKGLDLMIKAMPRILEKHPDAVYMVVGATHPALKRREGESYRQSLYREIDARGLGDSIRFHDRFVDIDTLCQYLGCADIYVTPYPNREQISSGTLAYAVGTGKAVVSTPYWYAEELLADRRGRLFPFGDHEALAEQIIDLLSDDVERNAMRKRGYQFCRDMVWPKVGEQYLQTAAAVVEQRQHRPKPSADRDASFRISSELPDVDLSHVRRLTDHTGILRHAMLTIPDRRGGYTVRDNALALIVTSLESRNNVLPELQELSDIYVAFLSHAFDRERRLLQPAMNYDRTWSLLPADDETVGMALWALGTAVAHPPTRFIRTHCTRLFLDFLPLAEALRSNVGMACAVIGMQNFLEEFSGNTEARHMRALLAERLFRSYEEHATDDWPWCEDEVRPGSAKIPEALILAGSWVPSDEMVRLGLRGLRWLVDLQRSGSHFSLLGSRGHYRRGEAPAEFDQLPLEMAHLIEACLVAYHTTHDRSWQEQASLGYQWFQGRNDLGETLVDMGSHGCRDGLTTWGPNENQGAEATLAWLMSLLHVGVLLSDV